LNRDIKEKRGQIAHVDRNAENNDISNLAYLCLEHHDIYDSKPSQSKRFTGEEVHRFREELYLALGLVPTLQATSASFRTVAPNVGAKPEANYPSYLNVSKLSAGEPRSFVAENSLKTIAQTLARIPPLSRDSVFAETYRGRWIQLTGVVSTIREGDECYSVDVVTDEGSNIALTFPTSWRADVEILRGNDRIRFEGQSRNETELIRPSIIEILRPNNSVQPTLASGRG